MDDSLGCPLAVEVQHFLAVDGILQQDISSGASFQRSGSIVKDSSICCFGLATSIYQVGS